jgi:hypothetical protein
MKGEKHEKDKPKDDQDGVQQERNGDGASSHTCSHSCGSWDHLQIFYSRFCQSHIRQSRRSKLLINEYIVKGYWA